MNKLASELKTNKANKRYAYKYNAFSSLTSLAASI